MFHVETLYVHQLKASHFRNFQNFCIELHPKLNLLVGGNAQGKTSILESLYVLSRTKSFRTNTDKLMIQHGFVESITSATVSEFNTEVTWSCSLHGKKSGFINQQKLANASQLIGKIPTVAFCSFDMNIVRGEPTDRRKFLDLEIAQAKPAYYNAFTQYKTILAQRNALLKLIREGQASADQLSLWNEQLAEYGQKVREMRREFIDELAPSISLEHQKLSSEQEQLQIELSNQEPDLLEALLRARQADIRAGFTSVGPHRDDLLITIEGHNLREYGSQGQQRTAVLAIKLALLTYWREQLNTVPVLLLDDIMSDLDSNRRTGVLERATEMGQVLITLTDHDSTPWLSSRDCKKFVVSNGTVQEE